MFWKFFVVVPNFPFALFMLCFIEKWRNSIHQMYQANESMSRHNPKKKQKQTINKNKRKNPYANRTHGNEMMINNNNKEV